MVLDLFGGQVLLVSDLGGSLYGSGGGTFYSVRVPDDHVALEILVLCVLLKLVRRWLLAYYERGMSC